MSQLSPAEIRSLLDQYLHEALEDDEYNRLMASRPMTEGQLDDHLESMSYVKSDLREQLALNDYRGISRHVDGLLEEKGIELERDSESYRMLCREMLKVHIRLLEITQKRDVGDYSDENALPVANQPAFPVLPEEASGETLSKVIQDYKSEQNRAGNWTEKTEAEVLAILRLFTEIAGDLPVKRIDHKVVREYKQTLMRLPANMKKWPRYRDKTVAEILNMDGVEPISTTSVNKHLVGVSSLFKYAVKNGFMSNNPAEGMQIPTGKRDDEYRDVFDSDDLRKLFCSEEYVEDDHRFSYTYWIPILGLFTGCRLEELAQLHLEDFREEDGVWVIDINNEGDKNVKTKASLRIVPIHPFLLNDLRLVEYVQMLKAKGQTRLFPELVKLRDGYSQRVSKWFSRYKKRCGIDENGKKKDFHSFRHTFVDTLKQNREVEPVLISELVGHAVDSMTMGRYGKRYRPEVLFEAIKKLSYDVDLSHLKKAKIIQSVSHAKETG